MDEDDMLRKAYDAVHGGAFYVFGISRLSGLIRVYGQPSNPNEFPRELDECQYELTPANLKIESEITSAQPNTTILARVNNQDGTIGHIDLCLDQPFDSNNLVLIESSAEQFGGEAAIGSIRYKTSSQDIEEDIDFDAYLYTRSKVELCWVSDIDSNQKEIPLYENNEWVDA
jgi:hypothetical protein